MIIGISTGQETCLILGQVSLNLLYWKENLPTDICGWGWRLTRKQLTSRPDHLWPEIWKTMGKNAKLKEKQKWSNEKLHWRTHENCEGSISLTRRIRNSKKPSRTRVRSWKHQWLLLCFALQKYEEELWEWCIQQNLRQDLRVFWKLVNLQDCVWENHCQIIVKTILQEKETNHCSNKIWFTNLFLCLKL